MHAIYKIISQFPLKKIDQSFVMPDKVFPEDQTGGQDRRADRSRYTIWKQRLSLHGCQFSIWHGCVSNFI